MPTYIALLRGINVGGHNLVAMSALRDLFGELAFTGVTTLLQSGNLVFKSARRTAAGLERLLETQTAERLGASADFIVRSGDRVGIYFAETGASQRASTVIYDRAGSSISAMAPDAVRWDAALRPTQLAAVLAFP